jgi:phosphohistidine swiveling domain-containing protein
LLDHGAAIARELALPCVVGCTGAWTQLSDGDDVWIDGQTGTVVRLGSR